jgi:hypothetical protein
MLRYFHSPSRGALARAPTTSLWQSVLRTRRVPRLGTLTASPDRATPSYCRFGKSANSPCVCASRCLSTQSVARSPLRGRSNTSRLPGPTPSCRTESHCASPGRIMLYELRLHARPCEREAAWCERRVSVHVAKSGMPLQLWVAAPMPTYKSNCHNPNSNTHA